MCDFIIAHDTYITVEWRVINTFYVFKLIINDELVYYGKMDQNIGNMNHFQEKNKKDPCKQSQ